MGNIRYKIVNELKETIDESNRHSASGSQKYVYWENKAIKSDYEFIDCECEDVCWCRENGCIGHYRIKKIDFDQFLNTYLHLWVPPKARNNVRNAVLYGSPFNGRQRNAIPYLQWLMQSWQDTLKRVQKHNKCGLCDNGIPEGIFAHNLYEAKMWSQLFYDSTVPFDSKSRLKITQAGYTNPLNDFTKMNKELFTDLKFFASRNNLNISELRQLDKPWSIAQELAPIECGQPFSRVLDKIFYSP
jgi:hypothetical protein